MHSPSGAKNLQKHSAGTSDTEKCEHKRRRFLATIAQALPKCEDDVETFQVADMLEQQLNNAQPTNDSLFVLATTIRQTLLEITEIKERNHERRHRELMRLLEKYLQKDSVQEIEEKTAEVQSDENILDKQTETFETKEMSEPPPTAEQIVVPARFDTLSSVVEVDEANIIVETIEDELVLEVEQPPPPLEDITPNTTVLSQLISNSTNAPPPPAITSKSPQNEFKLMREQMLEMQRRKMADRERKKLLLQQKLMDKMQR